MLVYMMSWGHKRSFAQAQCINEVHSYFMSIAVAFLFSRRMLDAGVDL